MNYIKWFGTITSILGAFLVAMTYITFGYSLFLCGSVSWLTIGIETRDKPMIILNATFMVANIIGLYNSLG